MSMLLFLGMFPLVGYGLGMNFGAAYFLALPIIVLLTALLPTGLGAMLALVLMRLLPSRYARDVLNVFSLIFTGFWLFANQAFRVRSDQAVSALSSLNSPLSPAAWAGGALVAIGQGNVLAALPGLLLFTSVSGLVFIGSLLMAERFFYRGWANLAAAHGGRARRSRSDPGSLTRTILGARVRFATSAGVAVFTKDRRIYLRDTQYLQPLLYSVLLGISWLFSLRGISSADTQGGVGSAVSDLLRAFTPLIAVILCNITAQAIGLGATSREGEGLWHLQIAPLTGKQVAQGKVWLTYLPYLIIGVPYAVIIGVLGHVVWSDVLLSVMALLIIGRGCAAILTWLDIAFPRREWSTPAQQISRTAFWLTWLLLAVYEVPVLVLIYAHRLFEANRAAPMRLTVLLAGLGLAISITWVMEHLLFAQATQRFAAYQDSP
jgi:ABC-2 type transport system permease protein